ncbi:hypothetical protein NB725_004036 [Pantoea ananatis]|nr:hypothetical protein [Pantoea ananatis]MCW0341360.1 hypothetical protein [Pantoea ananatis]MCW0359842.1 hypothetical protein [Pantoea ananatis]MCW0364426.1 hypothetical protein [Pantoea ananatis]
MVLRVYNPSLVRFVSIRDGLRKSVFSYILLFSVSPGFFAEATTVNLSISEPQEWRIKIDDHFISTQYGWEQRKPLAGQVRNCSYIELPQGCSLIWRDYDETYIQPLGFGHKYRKYRYPASTGHSGYINNEDCSNFIGFPANFKADLTLLCNHGVEGGITSAVKSAPGGYFRYFPGTKFGKTARSTAISVTSEINLIPGESKQLVTGDLSNVSLSTGHNLITLKSTSGNQTITAVYKPQDGTVRLLPNGYHSPGTYSGTVVVSVVLW